MLFNISKLSYSLFYTAIIALCSPLIGQTDYQKPDTIQTDYINKQATSLNDSLKQRELNKEFIYKSGSEGMGIAAFIKGTSVLNIASNPLIVVDGIPYMNIKSENFDFSTADERDYAAHIGLSQQDIKEISIFKDATAIAQYGPRAVNGVILVTTKRGTTRKLHVNYSFKNTYGYEPRGYEVLNGDEYIMLQTEELHNRDGIYYLPDELNFNSSNLYIRNNYFKNTDWYNAISQRALTLDHNLSVSGNINKFAYRASAGYLTHEGTIQKTGSNRFISRIALDYNFSKQLKVSLTLDYLNSSIDSTYKNDNILPIRELALKKMPNVSVYEKDANGNYTGRYFAPIRDYQQNSPWKYYNPVAMINNSNNKSKNCRVVPSINLSYQPNKSINYIFSGSFIENTVSNETSANITPNDFWILVKDSSKRTENTHQFYTQNQINYTPINNSKHFLSTTVSFNTFNSRADNSKFNSHYEILQLKYVAFNKYKLYVCGTGMKSNFNDESAAYYITPALSLQWFISREGFLKSWSAINNLSLYANYNSFVNPLYTTGFGYPLQTISFLNPYSLSRLLNPFNTTWSNNPEKPVNKELGIYLNILNRFDFNISFYNRKVIDQIVGYITKFEIINGVYYIDNIDNRRDIQNKGWEINLQSNIISSKNFTINLALYLYKNSQSISKISYTSFTQIHDNYEMQEGLSNGNYIEKIELNKTIGSVHGFKYLGVYATDADAVAKDKDGNAMYDINGAPIPMTYYYNYTFQGGDAKYADLNYDGNINASDITTIANINPKFSGSFYSSFSYKNWWLGVFFNFRYGNDIINRARMSLENMYGYDNQSKSVLQRWRAQGDKTDIPRALHNFGYNWLGSDRFVEDGSFLRLKAITLKYEFHEAITRKLHLNTISCFATCRNLFTITNYKGADPDIMLNTSWDKMGEDINYTANTKEFTFGINIGI